MHVACPPPDSMSISRLLFLETGVSLASYCFVFLTQPHICTVLELGISVREQGVAHLTSDSILVVVKSTLGTVFNICLRQ